jgi:uncharacterized protein (DUF1800 family)
MKRRRLLAVASAALAGPTLLAGCAAPALRTRDSSSDDADELATLNRVTWGIDSASASAWHRAGRRDYLRSQLHAGTDGVLPDIAQAQIDALSLQRKPMATWVVEMEQQRRDADALADVEAKKASQQAYQQDLNRLARDAATRTLLRALYSPNQLREQLAWFWLNHFNVHQYKANLRAMVGDYEARLRTHALGRFRDLLIASATHAAMIRYLDNEQNAAGRINENYARELMELHTLGIDGGYSQADVQELASVLTGMGLNFSDRLPALKPAQQALYVREGPTEFNPARHDMGEKQVLGTRISGKGWPEIIEQLTRLSRHPSTANHISRQLAGYFVADRPAPALVERMSRTFTASDGDIAATLESIFDAPQFAASLSHKFKDPMHYVVSAVRLAYDGKTILNCGPMLGWLNRLGQGLYNRQTPDGYPMDQAAWSGSGQMATRFEVARAIGSGSAGLFRAQGAPADAPAFPQLSNALYHCSLGRALSEGTRVALDAATSPQEWNVVFLSSPEFMFR